jgi:hypothetical protein
MEHIIMNAVSPREFTVEDLPEITPQFFKSGESYNTVVMGTTRQGMSFNPFENFVAEPDEAMNLTMRLANVDLSTEKLEKAKKAALDAASQGQKLSLLALIELWEKIPELRIFAENLRMCVPSQ